MNWKQRQRRENIPLPICLADCLREAKVNSTSEYVVPNRDGEPLSYTQFKRLWQYVVTRTVKERSYYRYEDGKRVKHTVTPVLGEKAAHNGKVVYSLDFEVTPHQLRHTYITNLIHASVDPKTVQYLAGHEAARLQWTSMQRLSITGRMSWSDQWAARLQAGTQHSNNKIGSKAGARQGCLALCFTSAVSLIKSRLSDKKRV